MVWAPYGTTKRPPMAQPKPSLEGSWVRPRLIFHGYLQTRGDMGQLRQPRLILRAIS